MIAGYLVVKSYAGYFVVPEVELGVGEAVAAAPFKKALFWEKVVRSGDALGEVQNVEGVEDFSIGGIQGGCAVGELGQHTKC